MARTALAVLLMVLVIVGLLLVKSAAGEEHHGDAPAAKAKAIPDEHRGATVPEELKEEAATARAEEDLPPGLHWLTYPCFCQNWLEKETGTIAKALVSYQGQLLLNGQERQGKGKSSFSYDLWLEHDLWKDAKINASVEGGSGEGLNPLVNSLLGVNADAGEPECIYVNRLYLSQEFWDKRLELYAGKLSLTDFFDSNAVANDENVQFLAPALVNNSTIPFPDNGLGAIAKYTPCDLFYVQAGASDAQASATEMGTNTAFHEQDDFFGVAEAGLTPTFGELAGNYRTIFWYDPQPVDEFDGGTKRDDTGLAFSVDQQVSERVTLFGRYGFAHEAVREMSNFWSTGFEVQEPFAGRADDVFGLGVAQGILGRDFRETEGLASTETLFEVYYNIAINKYIVITPDLQTIINPGGRSSDDVAVVAGIRAILKY